MDFKIVWTDPAIEALGGIVSDVAHDNASAAFELGSKLIDRMATAAQFPEAGPRYKAAAPLLVRCLTMDSYRLHYQVWRDRQTVEVLAVRHCAREQPNF